jgi:transcriptional regulator with XRE-family HTH domain
MNAEMLNVMLKKMKKTQKEMAEELGINNSRISDMKIGRLKGWKYRRRISQYLGVPEETLFPDDGNQESGQNLK